MKSKKEVLIESVKSKSKSEEGKTRQLHHNATTTTRPRAALRSENRSATTTVGLQRLLQRQVCSGCYNGRSAGSAKPLVQLMGGRVPGGSCSHALHPGKLGFSSSAQNEAESACMQLVAISRN